MLRWVRGCALVGLACLISNVNLVSAEPFSANLDLTDPATRLTDAERAAARALGEAKRLVDAGKTAQARTALERVTEIPALAGYVEFVRVRLLMREGHHEEAYRAASQAIENARQRADRDALQAALGVVQGEALAMGGDVSGAELAWNSLLAEPGAEDEAVRNSIQLSIVASRQRTGSLDAGVDPSVLLDERYEDIAVASSELPVAILPAPMALAQADAAFAAGRTDRAIDLFEVAIAGKLDTEDAASARMGRARALFRARRYEAASEAYAALLPNPEARFWLGRSLARRGDVDGSLREFERVARGDDEALASWALYLMGTLYEDRRETEAAIDAYRRAAAIESVPDRAKDALWRLGWAQYRSGAYVEARKTLGVLVTRIEDPLDQLRPRYWMARSAERSANATTGLAELDQLARDFPLTYYGWRAGERRALAGSGRVGSAGAVSVGTRRVDDEAIERAALLIEADLDDLARDELRHAARRARGLEDRTRVGALLARVGDYHRANRLVVNAYSDSLARGLQAGHEALWWLSWPPAYRETIDEVFPADAAIDRELVWAIMREESHYRVDARSSVGALGLLQLMPATANQLAEKSGLEAFEERDLFDPRTNILLGSLYLAELGARFEGRLSAAIGSYNAGPRKVSSWLRGADGELEDDVWVESIPYDQTRAYVKRVLRSLAVYKAFYRPQSTARRASP